MGIHFVGGCNIWRGDWIPNPAGPGYTNTTCHFIQEHQNCLKNGRPDHEYLYWRWKPNDCDLPLFDAKHYLTLVTGKSWAFVGDSIARNHFQSFLCSLAQVPHPSSIQVLLSCPKESIILREVLSDTCPLWWGNK
mgnify:FL=1